MSDGTIINNLYVPRIHKRTAEHTLDEARDMLLFYRDRLMILVAMTPRDVDEGDGAMPWPDFVRREVDGILESMESEWFREFASNYIIENGPECKDELEPNDWPETKGTE